jgi:hypothetical protein
MTRGDLLGAALVGGGLALLGVALGGAFRDERPPAPPTPACDAMSAMAMMHVAPAPRSRMRTAFAYMPPERNGREERARQVRVLVYRVQIGELTMASPEIPAALSADVADVLEGNGRPLPAAAAEGALPLDWQ